MPRTARDTRERLLDVAQDLIQRLGVNGMSFQDLSNEVGIRKASVHHHFASKANLIKALAERQCSNFQLELMAISSSRASGKTKLKRYSDLFAGTLRSGNQDKYCLFGMLMSDFLCLEDGVRIPIENFLTCNEAFLEKILQAGVEDGSLAETIHVKKAARFIVATLEGALLVARFQGGPKRLSDCVDQILNLYSS